MKKLVILLLLGLQGLLGMAQSKAPKAKLEKVTVFLSGAQLFYQESVHLLPGYNELVFENISPQVDIASIQASCKQAVVLDIQHRVRYREQPKPVKKYDLKIKLVQDSLEELSFQEKEMQYKIEVLSVEKKLLLSNRLMNGQSTRDSLPLLQASLNLLHERLGSILDQELKIQRRRAAIEKESSRLSQRLEELQNLQSGAEEQVTEDVQPAHQVVISLYAEAVSQADLRFNYLVHQASWLPIYDLKAESGKSELELNYFASITQNSGIDWKNIRLTLSTSHAYEKNIKPELSVWYLSFVQYFQQKLKVNALSNAVLPVQKPAMDVESKKDNISNADYAEVNEAPPAPTLDEYVEVRENLIRTEYDINMAIAINSDGLSHKVMVNKKQIPMKLHFAAVPKLSYDAFLMASVTGWEDLNLIPGKARVHFDGMYSGDLLLNASGVNDTLQLNLGRDRSIGLSRRKIKDKSKVKVIEQEVVEVRSIELVLRNSKGIPVRIDVEDQIPVSQNPDQIKIKLIDGDKADLDELSGMLKWKLKLGAKESKKIVFTYEIRYPKGKVISGL